MEDKKTAPKKKATKEVLNVTIDNVNMLMLKEIMEAYETNLSWATDDVLTYFREEIWNEGKIAKTKEEVREEKKKSRSLN